VDARAGMKKLRQQLIVDCSLFTVNLSLAKAVCGADKLTMNNQQLTMSRSAAHLRRTCRHGPSEFV
jgi:hypothetical protein